MYVTIPGEMTEMRPVMLHPTQSVKSRLREFTAGRNLFLEGDDATTVYEVVTGVLRLTRVLEDGRRQVIAFGYPGDVVGFPSDGRYHTDCDVLTRATLVIHNRDALESGAGDIALHRRLLQAALREISAMQDHFLMLGRKSASERVASFLWTLTERVGQPIGRYTRFDLPMSRSDIADFLGLTTETVSRAITQMRKGKVIALDHIHTVIVLDRDVLLSLADGRES